MSEVIDLEFLAWLKTRRGTTAKLMEEAVVSLESYALLKQTGRVSLTDQLHEALEIVGDAAIDDVPLDSEALAFFHDLGREKGELGVPLADIRAGKTLTDLAALRDLVSFTNERNHMEVARLVAYNGREGVHVSEALEAGYIQALHDTGGNDHRRVLVDLLVAGSDARASAAAASVTLSASYLILVCRPSNSEMNIKPWSARADCVISSVPGALWRHEHQTGKLLILLPVDDCDLRTARDIASSLTVNLAETTNVALHAAEAPAATPSAVPGAYSEAIQNLALVAAMPGSENRPYRSEELLVERALSKQPQLQARMAEILSPLAVGSELPCTLEALFECDLDREDTAKRLHVHRRTVGYRLQRIRELTGIDPSTAHGIQVLRAAITASRLPTLD